MQDYSMQDYSQSDQNRNLLHLVDSNSIQKTVGDRSLLRRFVAQYRQTGQCQTLPQLIEIARLAWQRQLIAPRAARILLADLAEIEANLPVAVQNLTDLVLTNFNTNKQPDVQSEKGLNLVENLTKIGGYLDKLMALARNHPDPKEPGVKEGFAPCYMDTIKRVNDLRYDLAYLREHLLPQSLTIIGKQNHYKNNNYAELQLNTILDVINDLYYTAMALLPRLRENITRKVPQVFPQALGSLSDSQTNLAPQKDSASY